MATELKVDSIPVPPLSRQLASRDRELGDHLQRVEQYLRVLQQDIKTLRDVIDSHHP